MILITSSLLVLAAINPNTKIELTSITCFRGTTGAPKFKNWSRDPDHVPFVVMSNL